MRVRVSLVAVIGIRLFARYNGGSVAQATGLGLGLG